MENQKQKRTLVGLTIAGLAVMVLSTLATWMAGLPTSFLQFWLGFLPLFSASIGFAGLIFWIMHAIFKKQETGIKTKRVILLAGVISTAGVIGWQMVSYLSAGLAIDPRSLMISAAGGAVFLVVGLMSGEK
ncbi:MAG: hypothetical protein CVU42_17565 [Chloroflexi bacterium HGW-Chloroflexi-4]|jgi:hypothetical protein|nr:MAG: hypothetical protein CVU42_17565 [Chloroflexi bacterium HGW-Chloroflexi-4]